MAGNIPDAPALPSLLSRCDETVNDLEKAWGRLRSSSGTLPWVVPSTPIMMGSHTCVRPVGDAVGELHWGMGRARWI